jgi:hypothetical protein
MRPPGAILAPGESLIATGNQYSSTTYLVHCAQLNDQGPCALYTF